MGGSLTNPYAAGNPIFLSGARLYSQSQGIWYQSDVTLNTDDPGMFSTDLNREYLIAHEVFGLDANDLTELARESVRASFAPEAISARVLAEIDGIARTRVVH